MSEPIKASSRIVLLVALVAGLMAWFVLGVPDSTESAAGLTISMTDTPDPVAPGGLVTYTITVGNTGTSDAPSVVLEDALTGPATIESATPSQGTCAPPTPAAATCNLGTLPAGATATIVIKKRVAGSVGGTAGVFGDAQAPRADAGGGTSADDIAPFAAAVAGGVLALGAGGWYARRRWLR